LEPREIDEGEDFEWNWVPPDCKEAFENQSEQFENEKFERIGDFHFYEADMRLRAFLHLGTKAIGIVYHCPAVEVYSEIVRAYEDDTCYTYTNGQFRGPDLPPWVTVEYMPGESVSEVYRRLIMESPMTDFAGIQKEQFTELFERAYAREMDWRMERGGLTEEEIRRSVELSGDEITQEGILTVQNAWATAISQFLSERVLQRWKKQADLDSFQREHLLQYGVAVHEKMRAEDILALCDESYYPVTPFDDEEEDDPETVEEREKWDQMLDQIRAELQYEEPQSILRRFIQDANPEVRWEFQGSTQEPVSADIWVRTYEEDDDDLDQDDGN